MKTCMKIFLVFSLLAGCAQKIDASSEETMKASVKKITESLDGEKKEKFKSSVMVLALSGVGNLMQMAADPDGAEKDMLKNLDGKTADEIIAEAEIVVEARKAKEREKTKNAISETQSEIEELLKIIATQKKEVDESKKFAVANAKFYFDDSNRFMSTPTIEFTVTNGLGFAISKVVFLGRLSSAGRSVPWVEEGFSYDIPGGLEPGESAKWALQPNSFGSWGKAPKDRNDLIMEVAPTGIVDAQGNARFDMSALAQSEKNLAQLEDRVATLKKSLGE